MSFTLVSDSCMQHDHADSAGQNLDILDRNWQTTAAIGLGCATAGVGTVVMLAVTPGVTLGSAAAIGTLAYAGHRRHNGQSPLPTFGKKGEDKKSSDTKASEPAPAAA